MRVVWVAALVALVGCGAPEPRPEPIPYALDADGIQLLDRSQRVDFGRTDHSTLPAMEKLAGSAPERQGQCAEGGTYAAYADGLTVNFFEGEFVGWSRGETSGTTQQAGRMCSQV